MSYGAQFISWPNREHKEAIVKKRLLIAALAIGIGLVLVARTAVAEPLPGEFVKFSQLPLNLGLPPSAGGAPFPGHDERSSAYPVAGSPGGGGGGGGGGFLGGLFWGVVISG